MNDHRISGMDTFMVGESYSLALGLIVQTRVGRRQWITARVLLAAATTPVDPAHLMAEVEAQVGRHCYGTRPQYSLRDDIRALKQAGLPVCYSRVPGRSGYYLPDAQAPGVQAEARRRAQILLRRIGWHPSDWQQIGIYAQMLPARKVAQLFRLRHAFMNQLRARLRAEHPGLSERELAALVLNELAGVREVRPGE